MPPNFDNALIGNLTSIISLITSKRGAKSSSPLLQNTFHPNDYCR